MYMYFYLLNLLMTNKDLLCKFRHLWSCKRPRYLYCGHLKISVVRFFLVCSFSHGSSLGLPQILSSPVQHKMQATARCGSIPVYNRKWTVLRNRDDFQNNCCLVKIVNFMLLVYCVLWYCWWYICRKIK